MGGTNRHVYDCFMSSLEMIQFTESESPNHMFMHLLSLFPSYFTQLPGAGTDLLLSLARFYLLF